MPRANGILFVCLTTMLCAPLCAPIEPPQCLLGFAQNFNLHCPSLCAPAYAQNSLWQALYDGGEKALSEGNLAQAEKQFAAALKNAESDSIVTKTASRMALVLDQEGKFPEARQLYERALEIDKNMHGPASYESAIDLNSLGMVCQHGGKFSDAETCFKQAIAIFEKSHKDSELAATLTNLALLMQETAKYESVEPLLRRALSLYEKQGDKLALANVLDRYAAFCLMESRHSEAEALYSRALSLREAQSGESPLVADSLSELGRLHTKQGDFAKAETELRRALSIAKTASNDKVQQADILEALAACLSAQERYYEAQKFYQSALDILQTVSGTANTRVAEAMRNLAKCYLDSKNYVAAESLLIKALHTDEQAYGDLHPDLAVDLQTLGLLYLEQGKYDQAEPLYKRALSLTEKTLGAEHPTTATSLNNLAWLYYNMGNYDLAEPLVVRALEIRRKHFGEQHPLVAQNLSIYAVILSAQHKYAQAESLLLQAIVTEEEALGVDHPDISNNLKNLAVIYSASGQYAEAEETLRKLLSRDEKAFGKENAAVASDLEALAAVLGKEHKNSERPALLARAQAIKAALPGAQNTTALPFSSLRGGSMAGANISSRGRAAKSVITNPVKDKWALVIGISNFKDPSINLKYAAKDATDFRNYLITSANFKPDHVRLLTDSQATRENIVNNLGEKWLRQLADRDDLVCIYISSHGSAAKAEAGATNFVVPYDGNASNLLFTGIPMQWLTAGLKDLVHSNRLVVLLDVCHGGAATASSSSAASRTGSAPSGSKALARDRGLGNNSGTESGSGTESESGTERERITERERSTESNSSSQEQAESDGDKEIERRQAKKGSETNGAAPNRDSIGEGEVVMASSAASQISWESMHYPNGVFTHRLIEALKQRGSKTTIDEAFAYMKERVEQEVLRDREQVQTPVMEKNWLGDDLTLAVPATSPQPERIEPRPAITRPSQSVKIRPTQGRVK